MVRKQIRIPFTAAVTLILFFQLEHSAQAQEVVEPVEAPVNQPSALEQERQEIRKQRKVAKLKLIMEREGPEYSEEKYKKYKAQSGFGITLAALGTLSEILALYFASKYFDMVFEYDSDTYDKKTEDQFGRAVFACLFGGIALFAVGIPFFAVGRKGIRRQNILKKKEEILFQAGSPRLVLSANTNSTFTGGGLSLNLSF